MNQLSTCLCVLFCLLITAPGFSQKAKDKRVEVKFVSLPSQKLSDDFTTYSVQVYGVNASIGGLNAATLATHIHMDGFKRVETASNQYGHLRVSVNTGTMDSGRPEYKSSSSTSKDSKGVSHTTYSYWYEVACSAHSDYKISDPDGGILASGSNSYSDVVKSRQYTSSSELSKAYSGIVSAIRKNFASTTANSAVSVAQAALTSKFDYSNTKDDIQLFTIKKHPDEDAFEANLEKSISLLTAFPANIKPDDALHQFEPVLNFWKKYADKKPGDDKDLQEVYMACNANLAFIDFYFDQFDEAQKRIQNILQVDKDKRSSHFLEDMAKMKEKMDRLNIHTMHFSRDLTNAVPPSKVKEIADEKEHLQTDNNSLMGYAVVKGDTIQGMFVRTKTDADFVFGPNGNTKFMVETPTEMKEQDLTTADVNCFTIGERNFRKISFSPCAKGKTPASVQILEEVYTSDKIVLYEYYPLTGVLANDPHEFAYKKKGEAEPISLAETRFLLWEKGISTYFSDCADLQQLCLSGGIKLAKDDLIKAARVYAEVCP